MAKKETSIAPKERINITYKSDNNGVVEDVELPLKMLMLGDYTLREDSTPLEDRKPVDINKQNFNDVLEAQALKLDMTVEDKLTGNEDSTLPISLEFTTIRDFEPQQVAEQVPDLRKLLELREALTALKGPLGNVPEFRKALQAFLGDDANRDQVLKELGLDSAG